MLEKNRIYCIDALDGLKQLPDSSIDLIITSPPYNKAGLNGICKKGNWLKTIDYGGDVTVDKMPETEYKQWQLDILNECYRVLKNDGSLFYNHKNRIIKGKGRISTPYEWLLKSPFKIRQEIIWDRRNSNNVNTTRFLPTTEKIFWLTKSDRPTFNRTKDIEFQKEVWAFNAERNSDHPAPFPVELPDNIIPCIGKGLLILDPFMGSGTTAVSAKKNGCDYIGFELFQEYIDMANERLKDLSI